MTSLLSVRGLRAGYGSIEVLHSLDLEVPEGSVVAVLGPNGAGKTTLLSAVAGLIRPSAGAITLAGHSIVGAPPDALARAGLCLIPEGRGVFPNLTVEEHLRMAAHVGGADDAAAATFTRFPRLADRRDQQAGTLSGGEQQMLALARGLVTQPALLLLDELSMGLAPRIVEHLYAEVVALAASGVSIVIVEQFAHAVLEIADLAAVLVHGRIEAVGTPSEITPVLSSAYLGATPSLATP